jgi:predicted RNA-binding protein with TRAM domain
VTVGEEYDVKIESMSKRGDSGVARVQGLVIFVLGTKVGGSVKIRVTKVGRGFATAEVADRGAAAGETTKALLELETEPEEETI